MENLDSSIKKNALNDGLILGVISFVIGLITFYSMIAIETTFWLIIVIPILFSVIIPIGLAIYFTLGLRKKVGGYWSFRQATTGVFIMFIVALAIQTVGRDLLFVKLVEPDMAKKTQDAVVRASTAMMEQGGATQEKIDESIAKTEKQFESQINPSFGQIVQSIGTSIIFVFILALIFGAFFKRSPPLQFDEHIEEPTV
jgi:hypothetical protein